MFNIKSVEISININFHAEDAEEILQNLKMLFTTPKGTVPFDRNFGINFDLVDRPQNIARALLTAEYTEQVRRYEQRARVKEVIFNSCVIEGVLIPKVVIELV